MASSTELILQRLRRRLVAQAMAGQVGQALLFSGGALLALAAAARFFPAAWRPALLMGLPAILIFLALLRTAARIPSLAAVAALVDRRGQTRDRYLTALAFAGAGAGDPLRAAALRECEAFLAADSPRRHFPWRVPREWRVLPIALIALGLVRWETHLRERERLTAAAQAQAEVEPTVQALEQLARKLAAQPGRDATLRRLAEQIARGAAELHRQVRDPANAGPSALRELSALEQMIQSIQQQPSPVSPEEMKALAEALAKTPETRRAAEKLKDGDTEAAAQALDEAAKKAAADKAAETLAQALDRLAQQQKLSQAMEQLREQMAQAGANSSAALQKLAQMLRASAAQNGSPSPSPAAGEELRRTLAALQNMKADEPGAGKPGAASVGEGKESGSRNHQPPPGPSEEAQLALIPGASGLPGSEKDPDFSSNPLGTARQESAAKGADLALRGRQGREGQTFSQLLPGGPDATRAQREYKALCDSLAPAAEDAVLQEEIPLGSRLFLRRYFEAIRPKE
jgi:hypothetical protein